MVLAFRMPPKSIERRVKKASENRSPKKASIFGSWALPEGERSRKGRPKGTPRGPQGVPKGSRVAKNDFRVGSEIRPVSEVGPERLGWPPETPFGRISNPFKFHFGMIFGRFLLIMPCATLKRTLRRAELLPHIILTRSQCQTAAAEGAKLSQIRRTPAGGAGRAESGSEFAESA